MVKIYLNDQHLILTSDQGAALTEAAPPDYAEVIDGIQSSLTSRSIHTDDPWRELEKIKDLYLVVQAGGGLVAGPGGSVLLIQRRGKWDLPKGKLEEGEDLETCAVREVEEETGLRNIILQKKLCVTYHTYSEGGREILKESHWYHMRVADIQSLTPQREEGIEECLWVSLDEIEGYYNGAHASIRDVLAAGIPVLRTGAADGL